MKDSFYEELERVVDKFPKYQVNFMLGDFNTEIGEKEILEPILGNESLHEISHAN
jgi:hypothetical protein